MRPPIDPLDPDGIGPTLKAIFGPRAPAGTLASVGTDDCAILDLGGTILVLTSDFVNAAPIGLELGLASFEDLGYYLVASNLSDLLGSGASPVGLLVNVMWDRNLSSEQFMQLLSGIEDACRLFGTAVLGGDTKLSRRGLVLNATAIGTASSSGQLFLQSRARIGDGIWVSGTLGSCAAAVIGIDEGIDDQTWQAWARGAITRPRLPLGESRAIASLELSPGGVDLSDGLAADLSRLADESGVGIELRLDEIPTAPEADLVARRLNLHPSSFALTVGGDLQFAVTVPGNEEALIAAGMVRIGRVVDACSSVLIGRHREYPMPDQGHRDIRGETFTDEIRGLIARLPIND